MPVNEPVNVVAVTALPERFPKNIPVVKVLLAASKVKSLSDDKAKPEPDVAEIIGNL